MVMGLPQTTTHKYDALCVFVCHLSKMVRLVPCWSTLDTKGFAKLFFREIFPHYGMPEAIVSDRGTQWNSEFFHALCDATGIQLRLSTAHHPQTNGLVERYNEVISTALRHFVGPDKGVWDDFLPYIEFAINDSYHPALEGTPFQMNRISLPGIRLVL